MNESRDDQAALAGAPRQNEGPTPDQKAILASDLSYLMIQIDRAIQRRNPKVSVRVSALISMMDAIRMSTQVAKEQRRQNAQSLWEKIVEWLRNH
jgi:hypothetical protein